MDRVWSPEMDECLTSKQIITVVHRYFKNAEAQLKACPHRDKNKQYRFFAVGSIHGQHKKSWINYLSNNCITNFCVDMAHGDTEACVETVEYIKSLGLAVKVMAGNIATKSGFKRLENAGADMIKIGIGSGCFIPGTMITTIDGSEKIENIKNGQMVLTHDGTFEPVIATLTYDTEEPLCVVNDEITCTRNHEFYVVHKSDASKVNDDNIHMFAKWIRADELSEEYMLIEPE